jgi:uncharacterized membrane protein YfcA
MVKETFTLKDSWIWILVLLVSVSLSVAMLSYSSPSFPQLLITCAVLLSLLTMVGRHYLDRYMQAKAWAKAPKLLSGIPVFGIIGETTINRFDFVVIDAVLFWVATKKYKPNPDTIEGVTITIVPKPFMVNGVLAGECVEGKNIRVVGEELAGKDREELLLRHGIGHVVLSDLGYPVDTHHKIFDEVKYNC